MVVLESINFQKVEKDQKWITTIIKELLMIEKNKHGSQGEDPQIET